jgi:hypothetical protein
MIGGMMTLRSPLTASRMAALVLVPLQSLLFVSCPSEVWIPVGGIQRAAVAKGQVVFLEYPPTRPHEVIGIITPPAGEYDTEAEAVKDMLAQAAKYGADAIYMESQSESGGWKFGTVGGLSGGSSNELHLRAKAIVWK